MLFLCEIWTSGQYFSIKTKTTCMPKYMYLSRDSTSQVKHFYFCFEKVLKSAIGDLTSLGIYYRN